MATILSGEIRAATIAPAAGMTGPFGHCHVLILSSDRFNHRSDTVIALPVAYSADNFDLFDSLRIHTGKGIRSPAWVLLDQIRTLPDDRIGELLGSLDPSEVLDILKALWRLMLS